MPDDLEGFEADDLDLDEPESTGDGQQGEPAQGAAEAQPQAQQTEAQEQSVQDNAPAYVPPWLRGGAQAPTSQQVTAQAGMPPQQMPQIPPSGAPPQQVMDYARSVAANEAARTGERPEDVLARMLTDPDSVLSERLAPLQQELQQMRTLMEMQMRAQQQVVERETRETVARIYQENFSSDPHFAGSDEVRSQVDRLVYGYYSDALARAAYGDYSGIEFLRSEQFPRAVLAMAKAVSGVLDFSAQPQAQQPQAATAQPQAQTAAPTPGAAREETEVKLPPELDEETLHVLERYGIPRDRVVESIKKWGWD